MYFRLDLNYDFSSRSAYACDRIFSVSVSLPPSLRRLLSSCYPMIFSGSVMYTLRVCCYLHR